MKKYLNSDFKFEVSKLVFKNTLLMHSNKNELKDSDFKIGSSRRGLFRLAATSFRRRRRLGRRRRSGSSRDPPSGRAAAGRTRSDGSGRRSSSRPRRKFPTAPRYNKKQFKDLLGVL